MRAPPSCRAQRAVRRNPAPRGFTLLEMLVVMVMLGLLAGVALPAMRRWHAALQAKADGAMVLDAARAAAFAAGARRTPLRLTSDSFVAAEAGSAASAASGVAGTDSLVHLPLPRGWKVERVDPVVFGASGLCEPGKAFLQSAQGLELVLQVDGPLCRVSLEPRT